MTDFSDSVPGLYEQVYVARQPIFTKDQYIWGYELLFRNGENMREAVIVNGDQATAQVVADGFVLAMQGLPQESKAFINFPRNVLLSGMASVLPPHRGVIEILETVQPEPEILDLCRQLKEDGYILALDDFVGQPGYEDLCALADIIKVDILNKTPAEVRSIVDGLAEFDAQLLAEKVENREMFKVCIKLGFQYFQGFFFSKPEVIKGRKLSASQVAKIKLLRELSNPDVEIQELVRIIHTDVSLSYRLLQYINSARFALRGKIESIQRAASMLGRKNLQQWLQVIILSELNSTERGQELVRLSVQRARFLELVAEEYKTPFGVDGMFLFGFFSMLNALLDQYMNDVLESIPLSEGIKAGLADEKSPHRKWLVLMDSLDKGRWERAEALSEDLGIPKERLGILSSSAAGWMREVLA